MKRNIYNIIYYRRQPHCLFEFNPFEQVHVYQMSNNYLRHQLHQLPASIYAIQIVIQILILTSNTIGCRKNGFVGDTCTLQCPLNCQERCCDIHTGQCPGCLPGYQGPSCNQGITLIDAGLLHQILYTYLISTNFSDSLLGVVTFFNFNILIKL